VQPSAQSAKRVLFVDDDPITVKIYRDGLTRRGFEVSTAANGLEALKALRAGNPDVVVLDLMMPILSGPEVLKFMRAEKGFEQVPVIVLSNAYMDPMARDAASLGAQKGLLKIKCNPTFLAGAISEVLAGRPGTGDIDRLLGASSHPAVEIPAPTVAPVEQDEPVNAGSEATRAASVSDSRELALRELLSNAAATARALTDLLHAFKTAGNPRDRSNQLQALYRKVHFLTALAGIAEYQALAHMASCFEALLFHIMDKLPKLELSLERTMGMTIQFLQEMLAKPAEFRAGPYPDPCALVVDDDRLSNRLVISALRNVQLQAVSSDNPQTALKLLQEKHFDLVLLDVEMPGMDGLELCRRLRMLSGYEKTPVIYVTLHSDFQTRAKTLLSGGTDLIAKPVLPMELAVKVLMSLLRPQTRPPLV
jgi:CheY-like chemotaxis protein